MIIRGSVVVLTSELVLIDYRYLRVSIMRTISHSPDLTGFTQGCRRALEGVDLTESPGDIF